MEQTIDEILQRLAHLNLIAAGRPEAKAVKGTTEGRVYILSENGTPSYVLKLEDAIYTRETADFLNRYSESPLLPTLLHADPEHRYLLYAYQRGTTHINRGSKLDWMNRLAAGLLNHYTPEQEFRDFGRPDSPCRTWREFNRRSLEFAKETIGDVLPAKDHKIAERTWEEKLRDWGADDKYWLHGDTGVHNFVFHEEKMAGVIDPSPIAGPILYDFTYAFCSSPDDLNVETLLRAYEGLSVQRAEPSEVMLETAFQLYCRIAICLMHHPQDLPAYLAAWPSWATMMEELLD
ncbi:phosphotransferase [Paenibacillus sp. LHD-117]|uniref:phosphotransferase n=1 Tax=Paenibacillus sp. LHD-117 TaxID=3071412 RepID=UPI0027E0F38D|nr:phosphotransferase [Paenibacillus sp. LHD-117]MDQ6419467.1 phosphotransferase [Paenibacillus sp. LHD-117]